jgi:hypothetical protein
MTVTARRRWTSLAALTLGFVVLAAFFALLPITTQDGMATATDFNRRRLDCGSLIRATRAPLSSAGAPAGTTDERQLLAEHRAINCHIARATQRKGLIVLLIGFAMAASVLWLRRGRAGYAIAIAGLGAVLALVIR